MKELNFIKSGDYYVPDIRLSKPNIRLGKWGRMRKEFQCPAHYAFGRGQHHRSGGLRL